MSEESQHLKAAMEARWQDRHVWNAHKPVRWLDTKKPDQGGYVLEPPKRDDTTSD